MTKKELLQELEYFIGVNKEKTGNEDSFKRLLIGIIDLLDDMPAIYTLKKTKILELKIRLDTVNELVISNHKRLCATEEMLNLKIDAIVKKFQDLDALAKRIQALEREEQRP